MKRVFLLFPTLFLTVYLQALNDVRYSDEVVIHKTNFLISSPTDYFRSAQTGNWGTLTTWESSPDNTTWAAATLIPGSAANIISIMAGHTITVSTNQDMDQLIIESGGILLHSAATLTINDGAGDDIIVQSGGVFTLASNSNGPVFSPATASANINTGGMLRLSATGLTAAGVGVNASNYIYNNASILEYTLIFSFSTSGVTYFPNANAATIPIFRITSNVGSVGANSSTVFNGLFEANGNITFQNTGNKTFRNGIIGTGNITGDANCGKFIINGTDASLGGSGTLTLPSVNGMDIGPTATVTMVSDKSVTGNIALQSNALVMLGIYNLSITGDITGGSATSHIVTNSSGKLVINNIVGATPRIFPIGINTTTMNALAIFNGEGFNYGARVETGINPPIAAPLSAVNRTWVVRPSGTPAGTVNVNFFYAIGDGNALFNYAPATVEQGFYTSVWNVINTGLTQFGGPANYQVSGTVNIFAAGTDAPMVIANIGAILVVDNTIQLTAKKLNDKHLLSWAVSNPAAVKLFITERSADGRLYISISELTATAFNFTDDKPMPGVNYYRLKMFDIDGKITYSNIAVLLNANEGIELINISPNPVVNRKFNFGISTAQNVVFEMLITDLQGRVVQKRSFDLVAGFNTIPVYVSNLAAGTYHVFGNTPEGRTKLLRFVLQ